MSQLTSRSHPYVRYRFYGDLPILPCYEQNARVVPIIYWSPQTCCCGFLVHGWHRWEMWWLIPKKSHADVVHDVMTSYDTVHNRRSVHIDILCAIVLWGRSPRIFVAGKAPVWNSQCHLWSNAMSTSAGRNLTWYPTEDLCHTCGIVTWWNSKKSS